MSTTTDYLLGRAVDDAVAFVDGGAEHTYGELRSDVSAWAESLADLALPVGSPVAILAPNGLFWIAAYLATMSLGLVCVPIAATLPAEEVTARVRWVGARAVFLGRRFARRSAAYVPDGTPVLAEGDLAPDPHRRRPSLPPPDVDPHDDAAWLFTSGTTGRPRAVRITHRNIQANTESILTYLALRPDERTLSALPFTYVFGASLLHTHLRLGARLVNQPTFAFPESVVTRLDAEQCTGFAGVPSMFHLLLRNSSFRHRPLPALRTIQQAGGRLPPALVDELVQAQPHARVFVMYGQTEATARLSYLPPEQLATRPGSIGRGIPGVRLRVVGADGEDVAPGQIGEIFACGENISPGYLRDDAATALKMPGGELRSGDLATVDADGYLYVVDRNEDFIKSWGYRIASQEVEAAAMEHPGLVHAAAVGVPDDAAGERIELVVVPRPGFDVTASEVLDLCRARLARHMAPSAVHLVEALPLSANGKVLKREVRSLCADLAAGLSPAPIPVH
ncbi:class I adenylate-forming enzyme family protein [Xylanimonas ulmi]|uniref:Acyl-CoA synthetase (AMP-forming)/AMP-acid ligase II n=1 Tax=Xylanimonas ulmi TaxID=228973 RepID=A0A4Q7M5C5_9MICO|nr:class I adenylate-forming enzyme family protein [Xylanibacterium ulmi]RZS61842.1 acyl-CoA synthetase (AMP-forming)/AMP-acid ligase II [Xylanibacterium ulmi]